MLDTTSAPLPDTAPAVLDETSPERLLRLPTVLRVTGLSRTPAYTLMTAGLFPKPVKLGRASAWPESEILQWIEARKVARNAAA